MTEVPHLFARARISTEAGAGAGLASEGLPPKWFTKDPNTSFDQDLPALFGVIGHAARVAVGVDRVGSFFDWWLEVHAAQEAWGRSAGHPALLTGLGTSLIERAVLDGLCRLRGIPFHRAVLENHLGLRLGEVHAALGGIEPGDLLPEAPAGDTLVRHTLGLADALTAADLSASERVDDGLPQTLEDSVRRYGLKAFKIKLAGDAARDVARLEAVDRLLASLGVADYRVTLDGNENFAGFDAFREFWGRVVDAPGLREFRRRVLFVEQPVHRSRALSDEGARVLEAWKDRPPLVIDESDGAVEDLERALAIGYDGTSHKNCKGIVKGLAHACLLAKRRRQGERAILSGEDLCNLGPVALLQDLALVALLGIPHVERNGHHYFRGLSPWPREWQDLARERHPDLYVEDPPGLTRLAVDAGRLRLASVNAAPFGVAPWFDPEAVGFRRAYLEPEGERPPPEAG
ncbi:MAG: hypothetical protein JNL97_09625 [Verrucomicrobiales bacterium]|nr:hypothetical protein [Verrucomicrobiales bacterium]